jgi:hypothetical protein
LSLQLLVPSQDYRVQLTQFFQFVLEDLRFGESLQSNPEKLILGLRVFDDILEKVGSQNRGKSGKVNKERNYLH